MRSPSRAEVLYRHGAHRRCGQGISQGRAPLAGQRAGAERLGYTLTYTADDYREAARLIKKALKLEPKSAAIIDSYGWVLYRLGDYEKALHELKRAYAMLPDPEVAAHIVEVLWKLDRIDEAKVVLEEAEQKSPDNSMLKQVRGHVFPDEK
ncbi:MAG: tetratricopeptide repeat protein [Woeseiaceae bacterium]|nr:tetratricopeptide repeat protein [Woeseiaceae bacterium]